MSTYAFKIVSRVGGDVEFSHKVPAHIFYDHLEGAQTTFVHGEWGHCIFQALNGIGVEPWDSQYEFLHDVELHGSVNRPVYELHSSVENHFDYSWDGVDQVTEDEGQGGFAHSPFVNNIVRFKAGMKYRTTDVHFEPWLLKPFANAYGKLYEVMDGSIVSRPGNIDPFFKHDEHIKSILNQIRHAPCPPQLRGRFIRLKCEELLFMAMNQMHPDFKKEPFAFSPDMKEKAEYLELILHENLKAPPSLTKMVSMVSSNMQYIQKAFKARYGKPIFKYLHDLRMEAAREMLREPSATLLDVAVATGLYDASHLSNAFFAYYGVRPNEFRKTGRTKRD